MTETAAAPYKDRHAGLIVFGIVFLLFALILALMVPLMLLGPKLAPQASGSSRMMLPAAATYGLLAVAFAWLGIGSIMARRWARALILILAWAWLAVGLLSVPVMAFMLPASMRAAAAQGPAPVPEAALALLLVFTIAFASLLYIVLPAGLVWFYSGKNVRATCEARDPVPRWTDACPLPVLALSLGAGFGALVLPFSLVAYNAVVPFFGTLLKGPAAYGFVLGMTAVLAFCALATYRRKRVGFWLLVAAFAVGTTSALITFARLGLLPLYQEMGFSEAELTQLRASGLLEGNWMVWLMAAWSALVLGYTAWTHKYFRTQA